MKLYWNSKLAASVGNVRNREATKPSFLMSHAAVHLCVLSICCWRQIFQDTVNRAWWDAVDVIQELRASCSL